MSTYFQAVTQVQAKNFIPERFAILVKSKNMNQPSLANPLQGTSLDLIRCRNLLLAIVFLRHLCTRRKSRFHAMEIHGLGSSRRDLEAPPGNSYDRVLSASCEHFRRINNSSCWRGTFGETPLKRFDRQIQEKRRRERSKRKNVKFIRSSSLPKFTRIY